LVEPEQYPEFALRCAPAVTREALGNEIQFATLRMFEDESAAGGEAPKLGDAGQRPPLSEGSRLAYLEETIEMYTKHFRLGRVLWPVYPTLFARNFEDLARICAREGLFLYDFWGYVPGSAPSGDSIWGEYEIPPAADRLMRELLGPRFLGYDNGEQDGRYIGSYAARTSPVSLCRKSQYANFQAHFEKLNGAMKNHTVTLSSLTFLHYFAKEGNTIMLGAETAQSLPSSAMWFSFIRGASNQYGLLRYGNASVWNRWGYKDYLVDSREPDTSRGYEMGRFAGTSLSLLRRLIYSHYMYNCDILGFENCWLKPEDAAPGEQSTERARVIGQTRHVLTPIGRIQQACASFVKARGAPGVFYAPLCIVGDFFAGWVPPRHLYAQAIYKVWGNLPYAEGDYQLHALFSLLYPGYENAGAYRDERGFMPASPFGDIADALLSDARPEVLRRYAEAVVLSSVDMTLELYEALKAYAVAGGKAVFFAETVWKHRGLQAYDPAYFEFFGLASLEPTGEAGIGAGTGNGAGGEAGFGYSAVLDGASGAAWDEERFAASRPCGRGTVTVLMDAFGLAPARRDPGREEPFSPANEPNSDIAQPFALAPAAARFFEKELGALRLLSVGNGSLYYSVCARRREIAEQRARGAGGEMGGDAGGDANGGEMEYTLFVANSRMCDETYEIKCHGGGEILRAERLPIDDGVTALPEFLPLLRGEEKPSRADLPYSIAAGDCHMWRVRARGQQAEAMEKTVPADGNLPLYLLLAGDGAAKRFLLEHPTFRRHFKGLLVPAEYLERADTRFAQKEASYFRLQATRIIVDFTKLINHYPDLTLIGNMPERTGESIARIARVLDKAALYGCDGAVFAPQRNAENHYAKEQGEAGLLRSWEKIGGLCRERGIPFYVQNRFDALFSEREEDLLEALPKIPEESRPAFALNTANGQVRAGGRLAPPEAATRGVAAPEAAIQEAAPHEQGQEAQEQGGQEQAQEQVQAAPARLPIAQSGLLLLSAAQEDIFGQFCAANLPVRQSRDASALRGYFEAAIRQGAPVALCAEYAGWDEAYADLLYLRSSASTFLDMLPTFARATPQHPLIA
jgi:hypothetical protein